MNGLMYTYQVDGVTIEATEPRKTESALAAALGIAAVQSFQHTKPVMLCLNGQPYRRVTVEFVERLRK